jgi:hypothetical protein
MSNQNHFCAAVLSAFTVLCAPLGANAYVPMSGTFNGLFFETNGVWQESSGLITISTTPRGTYTAKLQIGDSRYSHSGWLTTDGMAAFEVPQYYYGDWLDVSFQVDTADPDLITGVVSNSTWTATFSADREVFDGRTNICANAGRYTMILPGDPTSTNSPGGDSYGTIYISKDGHLSFSGLLADGYKVSQSATVSKDGQWPLYLPLYWGQGALYAWLSFNDSTNGAIAGNVTWIKPPLDWDWYYPDGFTLSLAASGSHYTRPPRGMPLLDFSAGLLEFSGGNLSQSITNQVLLTQNNRLQDLGSGWLRFSFSLATGTFSGRYWDSTSWNEIQFNGVVLQDFNVAAGCFAGWDQSGEVWLQGQ